jgi:hypothetical protein
MLLAMQECTAAWQAGPAEAAEAAQAAAAALYSVAESSAASKGGDWGSTLIGAARVSASDAHMQPAGAPEGQPALTVVTVLLLSSGCRYSLVCLGPRAGASLPCPTSSSVGRGVVQVQARGVLRCCG